MKVFVAPLDWGLGHATRCAPVVQKFLDKGCDVELAVVKSNASILREMFPDVRQRLAPSYNVVYPKHGYNMGLWLVKNSAHLKAVMRAEHHYAEEMVERHHYDIIVSDNRFAFYSKNAYSVYMTHQRRIAFPKAFKMFETVGEKWHAAMMRNFDEVWIPDLPDFPGYAGKLSHTSYCPRPLQFVGALSRFMLQKSISAESASRDLKIVAVISGVEPARTRFESQLCTVLAHIPGKHVMILGKPHETANTWTEGNITFYNHLPSEAFARIARRAEWVVSRGGYSTVMDMAVLSAKCIFVPTPGQYEQIVLAEDLAKDNAAIAVDESQLSAEVLNRILNENKDVALSRPSDNDYLDIAVSSVLEKASAKKEG